MTVSTTIGRYTLKKTRVASIEAAKEVAASSLAQERNIDIETVRGTLSGPNRLERNRPQAKELTLQGHGEVHRGTGSR